jgi:uncharacterized protein involved in outer membrane biogenesis
VRALIALLGLLLIAVLVVSLLRIPIDLSHYKPLAEDRLSEALGRRVAIDGTMLVTTSLWPYFELGGLRVANPAGFPAGDVAVMEEARISIGLPPLLQRRVVIREFKVSGMTLDLIRDADGNANWVLQTAASGEEPPGDPNDVPAEGTKPASDFLALDELELADIVVRFSRAEAEPLEFHLYDASGGAPLGEPMTLDMDGTLLDEPFALEIKADSLSDFLNMTRTRLGIGLDIADTRFEFSGLSEALRGGRGTEVSLSVKGADFSSLNDLLRLDLPPLEDYRLNASARFDPGKVELKSLDLSVKNSRLKGHMLIDRTEPKPVATLDLHSEHIQLTDFDTGDWTAEPASDNAGEVATEGEAQVDDAEVDSARRAELLSPETLSRADGRLTVAVDEVLSGEDKLGKAELVMALQDGRLDIDPLKLQLPKSTLQMAASLEPGTRASDASLRLVIDDFDFGVLSRLSDPNSKAGGTVSVDIDVTASARRTRDILSGANGHLDVVAELENVKSGLVDLWAVNLLSAVVSSSVKDEGSSKVNCMISRFRLENGLMTAEQLAADTSRIRICGEGNIDFTDETFKLVATPKAKRPEFFSLATPVAINGEFDDFRIGMKTGVLTLGTTATKFAISPITTPLQRIFREDLPQDGADICGLPIGPRDEPLEPLPGC